MRSIQLGFAIVLALTADPLLRVAQGEELAPSLLAGLDEGDSFCPYDPAAQFEDDLGDDGDAYSIFMNNSLDYLSGWYLQPDVGYLDGAASTFTAFTQVQKPECVLPTVFYHEGEVNGKTYAGFNYRTRGGTEVIYLFAKAKALKISKVAKDDLAKYGIKRNPRGTFFMHAQYTVDQKVYHLLFSLDQVTCEVSEIVRIKNFGTETVCVGEILYP